MSPREIAEKIVKALDEKKGMDICMIATTQVTVVADYFIIVNGTSNTHVKALADEVEDALTKEGVNATHVEGKATGWILLDYDSVVVHVFTKEAREYYNLEKLCADGEMIDISSLVTAD